MQNAKIKMQNDRAKGKIPNPKSETLNNMKKQSALSSCLIHQALTHLVVVR